MNTEALLNEKQVAAHLAVSLATLRSWRFRGIGPVYVKLGDGKKTPVRYRPTDIEQFIVQSRKG